MADATQQNTPVNQQWQQNTQNNQQGDQSGIQPNMQQQQLQQNMQPDQQPYKLSDDELQISFDEPEKKDDTANDPLSFSDEDWTLDETFDPEDNVTEAQNTQNNTVMNQEDTQQENMSPQSSPQEVQQSQVNPIQWQVASDPSSAQPDISVQTEKTTNVSPQEDVRQDNVQQNIQQDDNLSFSLDGDVAQGSSQEVSTPSDTVPQSASAPLNDSAVAPDNSSSADTNPSADPVSRDLSSPDTALHPTETEQEKSVRQPQREQQVVHDAQVWDIHVNEKVEENSTVKKKVVEKETKPRERIEDEPEKKVLSTLEDMLERIQVLMSNIHSLNNNEDIRITWHKTDTEHVEYMFTHDTVLTVTKIMHHDSTQHILRFEQEESLHVTLDSEEVYHSEKESLHEQVESYLKDKLTKFIMLLEGRLSDIKKKKQQEAEQQKQQTMVAGLRNF